MLKSTMNTTSKEQLLTALVSSLKMLLVSFSFLILFVILFVKAMVSLVMVLLQASNLFLGYLIGLIASVEEVRAFAIFLAGDEVNHMKKRHAQQRMVESDLAPHSPSMGYQREPSPVRLSIVMGIILVGVLIILACIVGIMSLSDVIRGHAGETWNHFTAMWDALKWWLLAGSVSAVVVFKVVMPVLENSCTHGCGTS